MGIEIVSNGETSLRDPPATFAHIQWQYRVQNEWVNYHPAINELIECNFGVC